MADVRVAPRARPLSPHLLHWRWHVTLAASIATRLTGAATYVGMLILAGWALALVSGREAYGEYMSVLGSIPGKIVLFGLTLSLFYHLAGGLRHLFWDNGVGFAPKVADTTAWAAFAFAVVAAIATWIVAGAMGAL
jgi:succinate dehydrogenase / fumarate reductase cytochrome b subunit